MSLAEVLLVLFVTLKLTGLIDWSWVWVTAPFWIPMVIAFVVAFLSVMTGRDSKTDKHAQE